MTLFTVWFLMGTFFHKSSMKLHIITFNPPLVYMCLFTLSYDILIASRLVNKLIWYWIQTRRGYDVSGCIHVNTKLLYFCIRQSNNLQFSWKFASNELRNTCIYNCCRNKLNYRPICRLSLIRQHGVNGVKMSSLATLFSHFLLFLKYSNLNYLKISPL